MVNERGPGCLRDLPREIRAIAYRSGGNDFNEIFTIFLALSCVIQQQQISELSQGFA
jgi:hypothetical protein